MIPRQPRLTVDLVIEHEAGGLVLVRRRYPPLGWALPGGFVEWGETLEEAARREAREETGLEVTLLRQLHTYSDPARDPRGHTVTTVFVARAGGEPRGADDAAEAKIFPPGALPGKIVFDHRLILEDYRSGRY